MPVTNLQKPKQIVVIGGGFAGLASAALLAKQGHQVTLLEKIANLAAVPAPLAKTASLSTWDRLGT